MAGHVRTSTVQGLALDAAARDEAAGSGGWAGASLGTAHLEDSHVPAGTVQGQALDAAAGYEAVVRP